MISLFTPLNTPVKNWAGKRIWVIGASSGIGAALSNALLELNATVILSARRVDQLKIAASDHKNSIILPLDVQDASAWGQAQKYIEQHVGDLDLILFCAAKYQPERIWEVDTADAAHTLLINLNSVYEGVKVVLPGMVNQRNGGIGIIASVAGYIGLPNASVYGPSKAALINLAEILYCDLHSKNINVYLINPGFVKTELTQKNNFIMPALQTPEQAASSIIKGMEKGQFEIHFPRRFTQCLKLLQMLPYRLRFYLIERFLTK